MEKSQMKNMVILKNLPSNLIEEAFVIFKSNSVAKSLKYKTETCVNAENKVKSKDYIIKEAEMIICNYISSMEKKQKKNEKIKKDKKYTMLKIYSVIVTGLLVLMIIL